jgi:hypothetical protein
MTKSNRFGSPWSAVPEIVDAEHGASASQLCRVRIESRVAPDIEHGLSGQVLRKSELLQRREHRNAGVNTWGLEHLAGAILDHELMVVPGWPAPFLNLVLEVLDLVARPDRIDAQRITLE